MKFNHAYTLGFSVNSNDPTGEDITAEQLREGIITQLASSSDTDLLENCGAPFDTYENEPVKTKEFTEADKDYLTGLLEQELGGLNKLNNEGGVLDENFQLCNSILEKLQ